MIDLISKIHIIQSRFFNEFAASRTCFFDGRVWKCAQNALFDITFSQKFQMSLQKNIYIRFSSIWLRMPENFLLLQISKRVENHQIWILEPSITILFPKSSIWRCSLGASFPWGQQDCWSKLQRQAVKCVPKIDIFLLFDSWGKMQMKWKKVKETKPHFWQQQMM